MRICATRFREDSNVNIFAKEKRENNNQIQYRKIKYHNSKVVSIISFHLFFFQICRIYKALIIIMIYECKHSLLRRLIL